ncbi:MAG: M28 family peptidase, partial [bacterium]
GSGVVYASTDGGATWTLQLDTIGVYFFGVAFFDSLKGWAAGGDINSGDAVLMATTDGGQSWNKQITGGYILGDVDFVDSLNGWCVGFGTIRRTTDGGATWIPQFPPAFEFFFSIDMLDTLHGLFCGGQGTVCGTFNSGTNWFLSSTGGLFLWYNVEAELPGVDMPDEIYIICGHHDDFSEDPMNNAPGADDNASGTSGVLETARILSNYQFHRTIKFVTFSGEEQGLLGSRAFAARAETLGHNIMGVLNLDMIGYLDDANHDLEVYCDLPSEWMADTVLQFSAAYVPSLVPYKEVDPGMVYSDHASFWDVGYSAVLHIERAFIRWNPYYHSSADTVGTLDLPYVSEMVKLAVASIAELADPYTVGVEETYTVRPETRRLSLSVVGSPFSERVTLRVANSVSPVASLKIYDSSGRLVREFHPIRSMEKTLAWEGLTDAGAAVSSGVYFARLQSGPETVSQKIVLVK